MKNLQKNSQCLLFGLLFLVLCFTGCGERSLAGLYKINGIVTVDGQPVGGVTIVASPVAGQRGAAAQSAVDGTFSMTTLKPKDGMFPGEYKVKLSKIESSMTAEDIMQVREYNPDYRLATFDVMPKKYQNQETSDLMLTVKAGSNPVWKIDISEGLTVATFPKGSTREEQMKRKPKQR